MILDKRKLVYKILKKKGDVVDGVINELLNIIRDNYENVENYQSIYDHHEYLISLIVL